MSSHTALVATEAERTPDWPAGAKAAAEPARRARQAVFIFASRQAVKVVVLVRVERRKKTTMGMEENGINTTKSGLAGFSSRQHLH